MYLEDDNKRGSFTTHLNPNLANTAVFTLNEEHFNRQGLVMVVRRDVNEDMGDVCTKTTIWWANERRAFQIAQVLLRMNSQS